MNDHVTWWGLVFWDYAGTLLVFVLTALAWPCLWWMRQRTCPTCTRPMPRQFSLRARDVNGWSRHFWCPYCDEVR